MASEALPPDRADIPKLEAGLALWLILFVLGGGLLALYYADLHYFPEFAWQDALTYLALMAIIGGGLIVAYSLLLFVPGTIWSEVLVFDQDLKHGLTMRGDRFEPCVMAVAQRILIPFALFMAFCHALLYLLETGGTTFFVIVGASSSLAAASWLLGRELGDVLDSSSRLERPSYPYPAGALTSSFAPASRVQRSVGQLRLLAAALHLPLLLTFLTALNGYRTFVSALYTMALLPAMLPVASASARGVRWIRWRTRCSQSLASPESGQTERRRLLCRAILAFDLAAALSFAALCFFFRIYGSETGWEQLLFCTVVVIASNLAVSVAFHRHPWTALTTSFVAALLLLVSGMILLEKEDQLPTAIMRRFGFGVSDTTIVLTDKGKDILGAQGVGGGSSRSGLACEAGITILSRLGAEYLLRDQRGLVIVVPKKDVISWSTCSSVEDTKDERSGDRSPCVATCVPATRTAGSAPDRSSDSGIAKADPGRRSS